MRSLRSFVEAFWSRIDSLLVCCGPSAVGRRVIAVVVSAIQRATGWTRTHAVIECRETALPLRADRNTSAAVVFILDVLRVPATLFHLIPESVLGDVSEAVLRVGFLSTFSMQTSTALRVQAAKRVSYHYVARAAIALTSPICSSVLSRAWFSWLWGFGDYDQASKPTASQIQFLHSLDRITYCLGMQRMAECGHG